MSNSWNVLVTGAGALLGQGMLRLLGKTSLNIKVYTADPDTRSAGHWLGDHALKIPYANSSNYLDSIREIIEKYKIDIVLIGTDVELPILSSFSSEASDKLNCKVIVSHIEQINIANNKFETAKFLEDNGFPFPASAMANDRDSLMNLERKIGFPLLAKPVDGARSKGVRVVESTDELAELYDENSKLVVQEYLSEEYGEFTSGCTLINGVCESVVTLKRDLRDGNTYRTYRDKTTVKYDSVIREIAECYGAIGPVNFQFRVKDDMPVIFEINCRYSGTTPLRYIYGFNEIDYLLSRILLEKKAYEPELKDGVVLRTTSDLFITNEEFFDFKERGFNKKPTGHFFNYKL